ncbi:hypothetical protein [Novosphingobium sp. Leaf2]|uniref:hypothetical protein n=1 Tax=Novosphingobium sp. Leaf2 TaxID=1735670 RepID=UPI0006F6B316|nr:hypothetical protein [Novosphingobium sp. Leaf2]KQM18383.1 hypothetical protein ASE49_09235 [Novosphingobium sp. Leaf2]
MSIQIKNAPFRRNLAVSPIMVPAIDTASYVLLGALPNGVTSFGVVNSYPIWIRLLGTPMGATEPAKANEHDGWLFPPGHFGIYSTQFPMGLSCIAVTRPNFPTYDDSGALLYPDAALELFYGSGA